MSMSSSSSDEQLADDYERCEIDAIKAEQVYLRRNKNGIFTNITDELNNSVV
jgi:uncharacterized protein (DUF433 family)